MGNLLYNDGGWRSMGNPLFYNGFLTLSRVLILHTGPVFKRWASMGNPRVLRKRPVDCGARSVTLSFRFDTQLLLGSLERPFRDVDIGCQRLDF